MLPEPIPVLKGEAAKDFIKKDKEPLTREQKEFLAKALEVYKKHPAK